MQLRYFKMLKTPTKAIAKRLKYRMKVTFFWRHQKWHSFCTAQ